MTGNSQQIDSSFKSNAPAFPLAKLLRIGGLLVCIIPVAVIIVMVLYEGNSAELSRKQAARSQIETIITALEVFEVDNGFYPTSADGLQVLAVQPESARNWHQYLKSIPKDPWQHDYSYQFPGQHNTQGYDLASMGPNGRLNDKDDITNWKRN